MAATEVPRDGTAEGLVAFFDYLAEKGLMNRATAGARKTAATKVLGIDEDWEGIDLRQLDLDGQVERFERLEKQSYKPNSLAVYGSRFRSAVEEYLTFLNDPSSFKAPSKNTRTKSRTDSEKEEADGPEEQKSDTAGQRPTPPASTLEQSGPSHQKLITYPFPLRGPGTLAYLQLPADLSEGEASRLGRFIESLAMPDDAVEAQE